MSATRRRNIRTSGRRDVQAAVVIKALAVPLRRDLFRRLVKAPHSVGELVTGTPATQSAVSQHLKVLTEAGLVDRRRHGTRIVYRVRPETLAEFRQYIDAMWDEALRSFANRALETD